jgi:solute carrier family 8 (sodium/calcium exchanger)
VGSAAFNLLCISAIVIPAVDAPKKIADYGVFMVTAIFSLFAYSWLFICLESEPSRGVVTVTEAALTLIFFFILLGLAFGADRYNAYKLEN